MSRPRKPRLDTQRRVLRALVDHMVEEEGGMCCRASARGLVAASGLSRNAVDATLAYLMERDRVRVIEPGSGTRPTAYSIHLFVELTPREAAQIGPLVPEPSGPISGPSGPLSGPVSGPISESPSRARGESFSLSLEGLSQDAGFPGLTPSIADSGSKGKTLSRVRARPALTSVQAQAIFDAWRQATGHQRAAFTAKRRRLLELRFAERINGGPPEESAREAAADLLAAAVGVARSAWNMGDNPDRVRYDSFELVFRDAGHVERFAALARGEATPAVPAKGSIEAGRAQTARVVAEVLARTRGSAPPAPALLPAPPQPEGEDPWR